MCEFCVYEFWVYECCASQFVARGGWLGCLRGWSVPEVVFELERLEANIGFYLTVGLSATAWVGSFAIALSVALAIILTTALVMALTIIATPVLTIEVVGRI